MTESDEELNQPVEGVNPFAKNIDVYNPFSIDTQKDDIYGQKLDTIKLEDSDDKDDDKFDSFYGHGDDQTIPILEQGEPRNDPKIENTKNDDPKSLFVPESGNYFSSGSSSSKTTTTIKDGVKRTVVTGGEEKVKHKIWEIAFYMEFFDIDAGDVVNRCLRAVFPFRFNFVEIIHEKPDLYGPFWITTSLIFLMAIAANFASYLDTFTNGGFNYDFYKIPYGAAVLYGYVFIIPISFYLFLKWVEIKISFVEILCVYGYSLFVYTPVALICAIPSQISQWIAVSIGCFISTIFLVFNLWVPVRERIAKAFILLIVITVLHVGLALSFKLYFFNFVNPIPTPIPSSTNTPGPTTNPF